MARTQVSKKTIHAQTMVPHRQKKPSSLHQLSETTQWGPDPAAAAAGAEPRYTPIAAPEQVPIYEGEITGIEFSEAIKK